MLKPALAVLAAGVVLASGAGCGEDDSESQTGADQAICASVADVQEAAAGLTSLDPANTTLAQLRSAGSDLVVALEGLGSAASDASSADRDALTSALGGLESAVTGLAGGESLSEGVTAVTAAIEPVEQAADAIGPDCPDVGQPTTTG